MYVPNILIKIFKTYLPINYIIINYIIYIYIGIKSFNKFDLYFNLISFPILMD